ncbi:hypothetical protein HD554DRAFT_978138 [Boletus coccyginus]|nr:hypothetical protein HD554DRAFT_978138 [Boletus coccyginus]
MSNNSSNARPSSWGRIPSPAEPDTGVRAIVISQVFRWRTQVLCNTRSTTRRPWPSVPNVRHCQRACTGGCMIVQRSALYPQQSNPLGAYLDRCHPFAAGTDLSMGHSGKAWVLPQYPFTTVVARGNPTRRSRTSQCTLVGGGGGGGCSPGSRSHCRSPSRSRVCLYLCHCRIAPCLSRMPVSRMFAMAQVVPDSSLVIVAGPVSIAPPLLIRVVFSPPRGCTISELRTGREKRN